MADARSPIVAARTPRLLSIKVPLAALVGVFLIFPAEAPAQVCPGTNVATGLGIPLGITQTPLGNRVGAFTIGD